MFRDGFHFSIIQYNRHRKKEFVVIGKTKLQTPQPFIARTILSVKPVINTEDCKMAIFLNINFFCISDIGTIASELKNILIANTQSIFVSLGKSKKPAIRGAISIAIMDKLLPMIKFSQNAEDVCSLEISGLYMI